MKRYIKSDIDITIDTTNLKSMRELMDRHNEFNSPLTGHNKGGESQIIKIYEDHIIIDTYQDNGWIRQNYYWYDGDTEELYEK